MLGFVVFGSRTWIWTMAAPALAASSADSAICLGVTGTAGLRPGVSAEPVTAHEIMILRCMNSPLAAPRGDPALLGICSRLGLGRRAKHQDFIAFLAARGNGTYVMAVTEREAGSGKVGVMAWRR